jgi:hypothetical protein
MLGASPVAFNIDPERIGSLGSREAVTPVFKHHSRTSSCLLAF